MGSAGRAFEVGHEYTAAEITAVVGGQESQPLPVEDRLTVAVRVSRQACPDAPATIFVGDRPRELRAARNLVSTGSSVPVFVREEPTAGFVYLGHYRAVGELDDRPETIDACRARTGRGTSGVLTLERTG